MPNISHVMPDLSFRQLDTGRYELLNPLGAGAFGVVYRARERIPDAPYFVFRAIKVVPLAHPRSSRGYRQAREGALHRVVSGHANIVRLLRIIRDRNFMYYVMEYCPGGDLFKAIRKKRVFARDGARVKQVFLQILDGVEAVHAKGVFHRDLKPENILLNEDCTHAWVADFGLATQQTLSAAFNTGSRYFMSPECVEGNEVFRPYNTRRSDMWALGVILLNLVTGRLPWRQATLDDPDFKEYSENPEFLRSVFPISTAMNDLVRRVLTMDPDGYISLDEFRTGIHEIDTFWMTQEEIQASDEVVQYIWHSYQPREEPQLLRETLQSSTDDDGDVLESETSSESTNSLLDDSDDSDERVASSPGVPTQSLLQVEEGRPSMISAPLPKLLNLPPQPETETKAAVLYPRPSPRTMSSDEFPMRQPGLRQARRKPVPRYGPTLESECPVTPPMRPLELPEIAVAAPLEDEVLQVERAMVAKLAEQGPPVTIHEKVSNFFRAFVPGHS